MRTVTFVEPGTPSTTSRCAPVAPGCGRDVITLPPGNVNSSQVVSATRACVHVTTRIVRVCAWTVTVTPLTKSSPAPAPPVPVVPAPVAPPRPAVAVLPPRPAEPAAPVAPPRPAAPPRPPVVTAAPPAPAAAPFAPAAVPAVPVVDVPAAPEGAPLPPAGDPAEPVELLPAVPAAPPPGAPPLPVIALSLGRQPPRRTRRPIANEPEPNRRWSLISMVNVRATPTSWPSTEIKSAAKMRAYGVG